MKKILISLLFITLSGCWTDKEDPVIEPKIEEVPGLFDTTVGWIPCGPAEYFQIYWGSTSKQYTESTGLLSGNRKAYTFNGLLVGTSYYMAVTALDADLNESEYSNEIFTDGVTTTVEERKDC